VTASSPIELAWPGDATCLQVVERGGRTELDFALGDSSFTCWIDRRDPDGRAFRRIPGARLGYRGDLTPESIALVEALASRLASGELAFEEANGATPTRSTPPAPPAGRALTADEVAAFARDGWLRAERFFDQTAIESARSACDRLVYGRAFEDQLAAFDADPSAPPFLDGGDIGHAALPFGQSALDDLAVHEELIGALEALLGGPPRFSEGGVFVRFAPNDARHGDQPFEGWHADHDTNSWLPPVEPVAENHYVIAGIVLTDVTPDRGPTHLIPGSHRLLPRHLARWSEQGIWQGTRGIDDLRRCPELPEPVSAASNAGDVVFWSSYMLHAAIPFVDRRCQRAVLGVTASRADRASSTETPALHRPPHREHARQLLLRATPRARSFFGWPVVGDRFWTEEACDRLEAWLPGIDASPYRRG
jgi:hypothetical protein